MPYAIVQNTLEPPSREQLAAAFRALPELTDYDAATMAKDAFGILVENLPLAKAGRLLQALLAAGVDAEMVDHSALPQLPASNSIRRADLTPEALVAYNVLDQANAVAWPDVLLIAAGSVRLTEFEHVVTEKIVMQYTSSRSAVPVVKYEHDDKAKEMARMRLELFLAVPPGRYQVAAEKFSFEALGPQIQQQVGANFTRFVLACIRHAPGAVLNRGAETLARDPGRLVEYPSRHAFDEENVWLLWRHFASRRQP